MKDSSDSTRIEEMSRVKDLIVATGFMQTHIPKTDFTSKEMVDNLTQYTLKPKQGRAREPSVGM
jgi:hypothetical protein